MKKFLRFYFDKWWRPLLFWLFCCLLFGLSEIIKNRIFGNVAFSLFGLGLFSTLLSAVILLIRKKWLSGILSLGIFGATVVTFIFYVAVMFLIDQEEPDDWAKNLKIPKNIELNNPIDLNYNYRRPDSISNKNLNQIDFQLYKSFQPGLYEYDFWVNKIEKGIIYLKAFEITQNIGLSIDRLSEMSSIKIYNPSNTIKKFSTTSHFTIYEGDWGHPYSARFEVWFKPFNNGKERKLFTKNYIIEGWMR